MTTTGQTPTKKIGGALSSPADPRKLHLRDYFNISNLNVPQQVDWTIKKTTPWGMMGNYLLLDCTCASAGHMVECWTANALSEIIIDDKAVLKAYSAVSGYDPATGKNDNGAEVTTLLKYWRNNGIGGHKIKAFTAANCSEKEMVKATVYFFGGAYAAFNMPKSFTMNETVWDLKPGGLTGDNAPADGHAVPILAYDDKHLTCISWGEKKQITWDFWEAYATDCYAVITDDFLKEGKTPLGFNVKALEADLLKLAAEKTLSEENKKR